MGSLRAFFPGIEQAVISGCGTSVNSGKGGGTSQVLALRVVVLELE